MRRRRALVTAASAVIVVVVAVAAYEMERGAGVEAAASPAPSARQAIGALGRIEPESEIVNVGTGIVDRLEGLAVHRGDVVKEGEVLGYLQSHAMEVAQRDQIAAELDEAKAQLATENTLDLAHIDDATIKLKTVIDLMPLKIEAQAKTIEGLQGRIAADKDILKPLAQLAQENITSRRSFDELQGTVAQEEAALAAAAAQLAELRRQAELDQQESEAELSLAKATLERARAGIPVASLAKQLALAEERARNATITAPIDGTILNVIAHPGELVGGDKPIVTMGDTSGMRAVAEVYETDIGRVRLGQSATVTSRALDRPLTGKVVEIGRMIFKNDVLNVDPAARADARVVEVRIELDDPARVAALTNLTVDVRINAGEAPVAAAGPAAPAAE